MRIKVISALASTVALFGTPAFAADLLYANGVMTNCFAASDSYSPTGQVFTVPAGETKLETVSLGMRIAGGPATGVVLALHEISGSTLNPVAIESTTVNSSATHPNYDVRTLTLSGGGLPVTPGDTYAILVSHSGSFLCVATQGEVYSGGTLYQSTNGPLVAGSDAIFSATFEAAPAPVPTLGEWAMIALGLILAAGAGFTLQRRMRTA